MNETSEETITQPSESPQHDEDYRQQYCQSVMNLYADAYQQVYQMPPKDFRAINADQVLLNGAIIQVSDLEYMTWVLLQDHTENEAEPTPPERGSAFSDFCRKVIPSSIFRKIFRS
jgi:hypothetical protein